tara:strand:- start:208 stop:435 length:228 start_codon:yes stop_codon:yes gene_type:complete
MSERLQPWQDLCYYCESGDLLTLENYDIDLTDGTIEIDGDALTITMDERIECDVCGRSKEVIVYARIHTWEVHDE